MSVGNFSTAVFGLVGQSLSILSVFSILLVSTIDIVRPTQAAALPRTLSSLPTGNAQGGEQSYLFDVAVDPNKIARAELVYDALSARTAAGTRRSINGRTAFGGFLREDISGASEIDEPIAVQLLRKGANSVVFLPNAYGDAPLIRNPRLRVEFMGPDGHRLKQIIQPKGQANPLIKPIGYSNNPLSIQGLLTVIDAKERPKQTIDISYPLDGAYYGNRALVRGFVHHDAAASGEMSLSIGGRPIPHDLGMFEAIIERPTEQGGQAEWSAAINVSFANGRTISRTLTFSNPQKLAALSAPGEATFALRHDAPVQSAFGATIRLPDGEAEGMVAVRCNRFTETPEASKGLLNLTVGPCVSYRIERLGATGAVAIAVPARLTDLPKVFEIREARGYSYSERSRVWAALTDSVVDLQNKTTVSTLREQSATIVSGVLKDDTVLDQGPALHDTSTIRSLSELDVMAGQISIAPPSANHLGTAQVSLPLLMRPQRGKLGQLLQLSYDSNAGTGSLGQGWAVDVPMITVDTKWGVPAYDGTRETESYIFAGQELVAFAKDDDKFERPYLAPRMVLQNRTDFLSPETTTHFRLRRDEAYHSFIRHGSGPGNYWWQVIRKDGVQEFYGFDPKSGTRVNDAMRKTAGGATFQWARTRLIDLDGHTAEYDWNNSSCGLIAGCVSSFKLQKLRYNLHLFSNEGDASGTQLAFSWSAPPRNDPSVNARFGIAQVMDSMLERITTRYGVGFPTFFAEQRFIFKKSPFGKMLLSEAFYEVAPEGGSKISDSDLIEHQCNATAPPTPLKLDGLNRLGKTKRVVCLRYHNPQTDVMANAATATPFLPVQDVTAVRVDNTKLDGAFGLFKGLASPLGSASILGTNTSKESGASLYLGFAIPRTKDFSLGFKTGATERRSDGRTSLVDMTGDGIPDLVQDVGGSLNICEGARTNGSVTYASTCLTTKGAPAVISQENGTSFSLGAEVFLSSAFAGASFTDSSASRTTYFTDADGDGLTDIVVEGSVFFNHGRDGNAIAFSPTSANLKNLAPGGGSPVISGQISELKKSFDAQRSASLKNRKYAPLIDLVQTWRAPVDGAILIGGDFLSLAATGDGSTKPSDIIGSTRLRIERARDNVVKPCFSAPLAATDMPLTCFETPGSVGAKPQDVKDAIPAGQPTPLMMQVQAGDIIYARLSSTTEMRTPWSDLDLFISYLSSDPQACRASPIGSRPFDCGARWERTTDVLKAVKAEADDAKKSAVLRTGLAQCTRNWPIGGSGSELSRANHALVCDASARQPYYWSLGEDAVQSGQLTDDTVLPQASSAVFSGSLSFPNGTSPLHITLAARNAPTASDPLDLRQTLESADTLGLWPSTPLSLDIAGSCNGATYTGLALPAPSRVECSPTGDRITVHIESAAFAPNGQVARLELSEIFDPARSERRDTSVLDWSRVTWDNAPRIVVTPDAPTGNPPVPGIASGTLGELSRVPSVIFVSPFIRNRHLIEIEADQIGLGKSWSLVQPETGPAVWREEDLKAGREFLRRERGDLRQATGNGPKNFRNLIAGEVVDNTKQDARTGRFDPLIGDNGYLLPGACVAGSNCTYEYRLAHVFNTVGSVVSNGKPDSAFSFDVDVLLNGKRVRLRNLGQINSPTGACVGEDKNEPLDPRRPVDCVVSGAFTPAAPAGGFPNQVGFSFDLTDKNAVTGRDTAYAFDGKPGDVLQIRVRVRPLWNADTKSYESCESATSCAAGHRKARTVERLFEDVCLNPDRYAGGCKQTDGPWLPLRLSEFRLGLKAIETSYVLLTNEYGLNLARTMPERRFDVARLSAPIAYQEQHEQLRPVEPGFDYRGWSRFSMRANQYDDDGKVTTSIASPPFAKVRAESELKKNQFDTLVADLQSKINSASNCPNGDAACRSSLKDTAGKADTRTSYPMAMRFLDPVPSYTSAKAWCDVYGSTNQAICQTWLDPKAHGQQVDLPPTCGRPLLGNIVPCFIGPDEKIWMRLPAVASATATIRMATAHRGPEELGLTEGAFALDAINRITPTATSLFAPPLTSTTSSWAATLGVTGANGGLLKSQSTNDTHYVDMNGDGYPDPIINGTAYLTGPNGLPRANWLAEGTLTGAAKSSRFSQASIGGGNATTAISAPYANGASDSTQAPTGDSSRGPQISEARTNPVGQAAGPEARLAPGFGLSFAVGDSVPNEDFIDVNGDGLPDAVQINGGQLGTQLNIGTQFVGAGAIDARKPLRGVDNSGSLGFNLGWKTSSGAFGGGLSMSRNTSMSRATLIDVNGDGLVDSVLPNGNGGVDVAFNNGWGFEPSISIAVPDLKFPDSGASETMIAGIGGHFSIYPGPLCWPTPLCYIVINPAFSKTDTLGRNLLSMLDVNGDGLIDFASTEGFYQGGSLLSFPSSDAQRKVRFHLNEMGKGDKLKTIINPTGTTIGLDYAHFGNEGIRNPKAVWAMNEVRVTDGFRPDDAEGEDQDVLITKVTYADGTYDRAERRFLGFATVEQELRGCADARTPLLSKVTLSGRCATGSDAFLRRIVKTYDTQSIYTAGLPLDETVLSEDRSQTFHRTSYGYSLTPQPGGGAARPDMRSPYRACGADAANLATTALDDLCLTAFRKQLDDDVQSLQIRAVNDAGNPSNDGRWAAYRLFPHLRVVRKNVRETSALTLRSLILYDRDLQGNVTGLVNFGHVRNPSDTKDDSQDDHRADITYRPILPNMDRINVALTSKLQAFEVFDRPATIVVQQGAVQDRGARVLRARSAAYDAYGANVGTQCRLLASDVQPEELASDFCADLAATSLAGPDPAGTFDIAVRKAGFAPDDLIVSRIFRDNIGNPIKTLTPFNHRGDWIETRYSYDRDPFRRKPSFTGQGHCLYRPAPGQKQATISTPKATAPNDVCAFSGSRSSNISVSAWHVSTAAYDPPTGEKAWEADLNRNTLFYDRDGWGRLRSVLSSWDQLDGSSTFVAAESRAHYDQMKGVCTTNPALPITQVIPCPTTIMMHVAYQDHRLTASSPWQARSARYVDGALYTGHSPLFSRTVETVKFADGLNRPVRSARSADACDDKTIDDAINQQANLSYGWCSNSVRLAVVSGKIVRNALGETLAEYYPWPVELNAATDPVFAGFTTNKYLDWVFAGAAPATLSRTTQQLDVIGRPMSVVTPDGNTTQIGHEVVTDTDGGQVATRLKTTLIDPRCTLTQYRRDARGLVVGVLEDQGERYRETAHLTDESSGNGRTKAWCLSPKDAASAAATAIAAEAGKPDAALRFAETGYVYDGMAQLTDVVVIRRPGSELGRIRIAYDNLGRRIRIADPDRGIENIQYDRLGNVRLRDYSPLQGSGTGHTKSVLQDFDANRVAATRYPGSPELDVRYRYDSLVGFDFKEWQPVDPKAAKALSDAMGVSCDNCIGRLVATQDQAGLTAQDYDVFGQHRNQRKSFLVDRIEKGRFSIYKDYDRWGLLKSHQVQELEPTFGQSICFDPATKLFVCDFSEIVQYGYNRAGQVHSVAHNGETVARFAYDAFGAVGAKWTNDGTTTRYLFGAEDRRLSSMSTRLWDGRTIQKAAYAYDPGGNISQYSNDAGSAGSFYQTTFDYSYDAANRLTGFSGGIKDDATGSNLSLAPETYRYDTMHRMKSMQVAGSQSEYRYVDELDVGVPHPFNAPRLIDQTTGGSSSRTTLHYDDWGNLAKQNRIGKDGALEEQRVLKWDSENRLSALSTTAVAAGTAARSTVAAEYVYNRSGQRAIKIAPRLGEAASTQQREVSFYVSEILTRRWNENTAALHLSAGGKRIGSKRLSKTSQGTARFSYFYHSELPNGSVTAVTKPSGGGSYQGELIERLEYRPFGGVIERPRLIGAIAGDGTVTSDELKVIVGDTSADRRLPFYAYSGKEFDMESGYLYFGARYYDPKTAIWLNADPALGSYLQGQVSGGVHARKNLSAFAFSWANPITFADRDGRSASVAQKVDTHFSNRANELYYKDDNWFNLNMSPPSFIGVATVDIELSKKVHAGAGFYKSYSFGEKSYLGQLRHFTVGEGVTASLLRTSDEYAPQMSGVGVALELTEKTGVELFGLKGEDNYELGLLFGVQLFKYEGLTVSGAGGIEVEIQPEWGGKTLRAIGEFERNLVNWMWSQSAQPGSWR